MKNRFDHETLATKHWQRLNQRIKVRYTAYVCQPINDKKNELHVYRNETLNLAKPIINRLAQNKFKQKSNIMSNNFQATKTRISCVRCCSVVIKSQTLKSNSRNNY